MRRIDHTSTLEGLLSSALETGHALSEAVWVLLLLPFSGSSQAAPADEQREELRAKISEIRRLLRVALSAGVDQDIIGALNLIAKRRKEFERAFVVWVDLIEVLIQTQEQRYGPRAGLGALKAQEVKEVFRYLLRNRRIPIPNVPRAFEPLILDVLVGWLVDAVVSIANSYGLWKEVPPERSTLSVFLSLFWFKLKRVLSPLADAVAGVIARIWEALRPRVVLSPAVREAVEAVEREGMIDKSPELITDVVGLVSWLGSHRKQLTAAIELVGAAVQEAESYFSLSGPEKKMYARALVLAALDELGFTERVGLVFAVIESLIDASIEAAVHLFNKRGVFT